MEAVVPVPHLLVPVPTCSGAMVPVPNSGTDNLRLLEYQCTFGTGTTLTGTGTVTPRFPIQPEWRIRTGFRARDYILGLFTYFFRHWWAQVL